MRYTLKNEHLIVEADSFGAEIKSMKRRQDGLEYMWHGDPQYWGRTSPVLFPFVGAVKGGKYRHEGREYPMGQHGFARDMEFALVSWKEKDAPFVCIEPWYGRCDATDFCGELRERDYENQLEAGACFEAEYEIYID